MTAGIVLDAETAALVPEGGRCLFPVEGAFLHGDIDAAAPGDILTHIGGRPVDELVAAHDEAKAWADELRDLTGDLCDHDLDDAAETVRLVASFLDAQADALIAPALVAAYKAQHDTDGAGL